MGVTTKKKTKPIIMGEITFPSKIPNWIHNLFKGVNKLGRMKVTIKNTKDKPKDQRRIFKPFFKG